MELDTVLNVSRLIVALSYLALAGFAACMFRRVSFTGHKIGAIAVFIIAIMWGVFYLILSFLAPLDPEEIRVASLMSRVNHMPTIAALGSVLFALLKQHQSVAALTKVPDEVDD